MIYGIGIDIVETVRIQQAVERWGKRFLERVYTDGEIAYAYRKKDPYLSLSVRFAAKEAFIKAFSPGQVIPFTDVEVRNQHTGKPLMEIRGRTGELLKQKSIQKVHVSLSHEKDYSIACVVIEGGL
jgi:holo-[acyl-carrier protein] synthase